MNVPSARIAADGRAALVVVLALGGAMVLGGGGSPSPVPEAALQIWFAVLVGAWLVLVPSGRGSPPPREAWVIAGLLLLIPVIQLVPLPPAVWHALPGRALERDSLALAGGQDSWRPLSLAPARTMASLLALAPPAVLIVMIAALGRHGRNMVIGTVAGVGALALLMGLAQIATSGAEGASPFRFYVVDVGYLNGFQANHNAAADVLLIAMVAQAATIREWFRLHRPDRHRRAELVLAGAIAAVMSVGVFLTASRAGTFLLPVAWLGMAAILLPGWGISRKRIVSLAGMAGAGVAGLAVLVGMTDLGGRILMRYDFSRELRFQLWSDAIFAARAYFPWGAGVGTFVPVFLAAERLEAVHATTPNRAHNDYLELMIEAGVMGYLVLAVVIAILAVSAVRALRRQSGVPASHACFSLASLSVIAMHSLVDYPLRSMSLACLGAAAAGMLLPPIPGRREMHAAL